MDGSSSLGGLLSISGRGPRAGGFPACGSWHGPAADTIGGGPTKESIYDSAKATIRAHWPDLEGRFNGLCGGKEFIRSWL